MGSSYLLALFDFLSISLGKMGEIHGLRGLFFWTSPFDSESTKAKLVRLDLSDLTGLAYVAYTSRDFFASRDTSRDATQRASTNLKYCFHTAMTTTH